MGSLEPDFMKRFLSVLIVLFAVSCLIGCEQKKKSDKEIAAEQLSLIDSLLRANVPITTNTYELNNIDDIQFSAKEMIYKGDTLSFLVIFIREDYGSRIGAAIVSPKEINEICANIDSIGKKVDTQVSTNQNVIFSTNKGFTIKAENNWGINAPWSISVMAHYDGNASTYINKEELMQIKKKLLDSYSKTDGFKHLNKLNN